MRILVAGLLLIVSVFTVFAQDDMSDLTIAEIVVASAEADPAEFSILLTAVANADPLVLEALSNPDAELTVFAPTDAAFGALIEAVGEEAFNALVADTEALTELLLYHVLDGVVLSEDVVALLEESAMMMMEDDMMEDDMEMIPHFSVQTLQGQYLDIAGMIGEMDAAITIDDANLVAVDIIAANGVIHVIDAVIAPETDTIAEVVMAFAEPMDEMEMEAEFTTLLTAITLADPAILEALADPDAELTVFAPTDEAFAVLAEALGEEAFGAVLADVEGLSGILLYHVVEGVIYEADLVALLEENDMELEVETLFGDTVIFTATEDGVFINDAEIIMTDVEAANGVIHVIDAVILPEAE